MSFFDFSYLSQLSTWFPFQVVALPIAGLLVFALGVKLLHFLIRLG
jgi:hypothetical protein